MLDPRRLLTFRAVAAHRSFSRAAEALSLSQPAVSHQVAALERELGTALLVRGRAGTVPTPAGELLLVHAEALAARLALADDQMAALAAGERRTLRLGAFPTALATIVPAAVGALRADEPELEVAIEEGRADELAGAVAAGRLDAAVCFQDAAAPRRGHDGLRRAELGEEPMLALLPAGHRLAGRARIDLRALAGEAWMAPFDDAMLVGACRAAGFAPRIVDPHARPARRARARRRRSRGLAHPAAGGPAAPAGRRHAGAARSRAAARALRARPRGGRASARRRARRGAHPRPRRVASRRMSANEKPDVDVPVGEPPSYQLELEDITEGDGDEAVAGKIVEVHYVGVSWATGKQFDASWDRGDTFKFGLGKGQVIRGWDQGVAGMKVGGRRRITIPPDLAYGKRGAGGVIGPDETLVFVVDLVGVR